MIRVLVADDQALIRDSFRLLLDLEPDLEVVGEAGDGREAVAQARRLQPDVVLMDIRMPVLDGLGATRAMTQAGLGSRVLILTTYDADEYLYDAMQAGAVGFLLKDVRREQLAGAVRTVAAGDALLHPALTRRLVERFVQGPPPGARPPALAQLTERETEVLTLVGRGLSNAEIAAELFLGEATVKTHLGRVLTKLGLRDRVQAVVTAYESGLVRPGRTRPDS
ncbi:response regulator [Blastococcus sp. PRF04-17]|uniref:response regulator n=1 Tax=Blastococcus sp. PRF04-17 TaxID=2933797 RepID=UPI001FF1F7B3|nr:response regulator transcription factor [Blastococcus sp. PRF04-17]UOY03665.1 response regulator transcription factor [Blastococcus sp. PRF04-17]